MQQKKYDRAAEDIGNIVGIGHVNVCITDQHHGTDYYVTGLGYTRDPFLNTASRNMWINVGMSQFHLPMGTPDVLRGVVGLVSPDRAALLDRLARVRKTSSSTAPSSSSARATIASRRSARGATASTSTRRTLSASAASMLGMPYIRFDVRPGTAEGIARFYREILDAPSQVHKNGAGPEARVQVGEKQYFYFRETDAPETPYDKHHVQIYLSDFSGPYRKLLDLGLITMESNQYEYRFKDVIDLDTKEVLFTVEHETRSQTNPMYGRPLINRNPAATNMDYKPGHDGMSWALP